MLKTNIISKKQSYGVYQVGNKHRVVKNIADFDDPKEAIKIAFMLAKGEITEEEVQQGKIDKQ